MAHTHRMEILRGTPTALTELDIEAYTLETQLRTIGAGFPGRHHLSMIEDFPCTSDGLAFGRGATFSAVKGVVREIADFFHLEGEGVGREGGWGGHVFPRLVGFGRANRGVVGFGLEWDGAVWSNAFGAYVMDGGDEGRYTRYGIFVKWF